MFIKEITFNLANVIATRQYENVRPEASVTVGFADRECDPSTPTGEKLLNLAFETAMDRVTTQLLNFREEFDKLQNG